MANSRILVEALSVATSGEGPGKTGAGPPVSWSASFGATTLLTGGASAHRRAVLRAIVGIEKPVSGRVVLEDGDRRNDLANSKIIRAWLPAPGEEVFVGATVAEELAFPHPAQFAGTLAESPGAFPMGILGDSLSRSVWDLSSSERRLLLLAAQARHNPELWLCVEPLARLDEANARVVLEYLADQVRAGAAVILAAADPAPLAGVADSLVVLDGAGRLSGEYNLREVISGAQPEGLEDFPFHLASSRLDNPESVISVRDELNEIIHLSTKRKELVSGKKGCKLKPQT